MGSDVLLLLPVPGGVGDESALARLVFDSWWQGAAAVVLGDAGAWPVPVERVFVGTGVTLGLRFWLWRRRARRVLVAGPEAAALVAELRRLGFAAGVLGGASWETTAADAAGLLRPA